MPLSSISTQSLLAQAPESPLSPKHHNLLTDDNSEIGSEFQPGANDPGRYANTKGLQEANRTTYGRHLSFANPSPGPLDTPLPAGRQMDPEAQPGSMSRPNWGSYLFSVGG